MAKKEFAVIRLSKHTSIYRGFSVVEYPRTITNPIKRYCISREGQSYGLFDALALAISYIDKLHSMRGAA
ncbi:hypothetical protein [Brenneria uluponensis]|uniref:hypothetical protein n=1 Tax=Brenneria uluponensis TaxID=3057057 RepID=UPI0028EB4E34|nr:hypothetical protein [Brenneria ulupoensis]